MAIRNFDPKKGGAERYAFDLSTNLRKRGHDVVVFCANGIACEADRVIRGDIDFGDPNQPKRLLFRSRCGK